APRLHFINASQNKENQFCAGLRLGQHEVSGCTPHQIERSRHLLQQKQIDPEEVDRARQETKLLRASAAELEKRTAAQQSQWGEILRARQSEMSLALEQGAVQTGEISAMREALAIANSRAEELKGMLEKQQLASEAMIAQLTQALTNQSRQPMPTADSKKGKK
ncbi:MAG: hypothetical protein ACREXG_04090, partial [Polaromonas sp.]